MIDDPYQEFRREEMILRDWLALDRTVFANKRTFLAYARTAIALVALGAGLIRFIDHELVAVAGFFLVGFGVVVFFVGLREFVANTERFKQLISKEKELEARMTEAAERH